MPWEETGQPGVFSRPIGENEAFIKLVGDTGIPLNREHWAIDSTASIVPTGSLADADLTDVLRRAWAHLRFQHPSIAVRVDPDDDTRFLYRVPQESHGLEGWVSHTFSVAPEANSSADVIPSLRPSPYATLTYIPRSGELLSHTAHWRSDGIGVALLLDALLSIAARPHLEDAATLAWGTEIERLTPSVEEAAAMPEEPSEDQQKFGSALVGTFAHVAGAAGIPYLGDAATVPAGTRSATLALDPRMTERVVAACKARGVSVTTAVHASMAAANYALADEAGRQKHYTSTVRFGLRPYLPASFSMPSSAAGLYTTGWMKRVEADGSWEYWLKEYGAEYRKGISKEFLESHREYVRQLAALIHAMPETSEMPSDVDISSIGVAEHLVKRSYGDQDHGIDVQAISVGVEILTRQSTCFVWTFRDQLNLRAVYNESFHSAEQMDQFVHTVKTVLLERLEIEDSA